MRKIHKKKSDKLKAGIAAALVLAVIASLGILVFKKPSITGFAVITKETTYSDNLNLVVNESKNVTWNLRNPGSLQSLKASGAISRNGSAKVYIEQDGERVLIFDSAKTLFDVDVRVLPDYKRISQGEELLIQIILFNLRGFGTVDVNVRYSINDPNGNPIATQEEVVSVETQAKFVRKLLIPSDLSPGTYVAFVEVKTPDDLVGTSSDLFEVAAEFEEKYPVQFRYYVLGLAFVFVLFVIIIFLVKLLYKLQKKKEVKEFREKIPLEKTQKLHRERRALEAAYASKFISEESYKKNKKRIENEMKKLWFRYGVKKEDAKESKLSEKLRKVDVGKSGKGVKIRKKEVKKERSKLAKCRSLISNADDALQRNDKKRAKDLYLNASALYAELDSKEKNKIYDELMQLYRKLRR